MAQQTGEASKREVAAKAEMLIRRPVAQVFDAFVDRTITNKFWFSSGRLEPGAIVTWHWQRTNLAVDATEGLAFVLAGAKAWLEHGCS